jgi:hypothetical protein
MFSVWYDVAEGVMRSPFPRVLIEVGIMKVCRMGDVKKIDDLIHRLEGAAIAPVQAQAAKFAQPAPKVSPQVQRAQPAARPKASLGFEAVETAGFPDAEKKWQEFMRWVVVKKLQVASILQDGGFMGIEGDSVKLAFSNALFADMLTEEARAEQIGALLQEFFGRRLRIDAAKTGAGEATELPQKRKKELVREALGSDIVKTAADVLGAKLHEVKVEKDE